MTGSNVTVISGADSFSAYLATPARTSGPTILVLQEIFGVNENIRSIADDFAALGYIAIAPDIFWRQRSGVQLNPASAEDRDAAMGLMKALDQNQAAEDGYRALQYATSLPGANGRSAAVGYCLGGKLAYLVASKHPIDAAVSYYGVGIQGALDEAKTIKGALLLHIAGEDHLCPPEAQAKIIEAMKPLGGRVAIEIYDGVGHAFARRGGQTYVEQAATRADAATTAFLKTHLGD